MIQSQSDWYRTPKAAAIEAIERVVTTVERTQRAKDVEGFLALFPPAATWTTAHGKVLIGLEAIADTKAAPTGRGAARREP